MCTSDPCVQVILFCVYKWSPRLCIPLLNAHIVWIGFQRTPNLEYATCSTFWIFLWYSTASTLLCVSVRLLWLKLPDISPWDFAEPRQRRRSWCRKQLQLAWVHWQSRSFPVSHPAGPHGAGLWMCLQMLASRVRRVAPLVGLKGQLRPIILALWCQIQGWAAMWAPSIYNAQMVMEDHRTLFL